MYVILKGDFIAERRSPSGNSIIELFHENLKNNETSVSAKEEVNQSNKRKFSEDQPKSLSKKKNTGLSESNINKKKNDEVLDQNQLKISENGAAINSLLRKVRECDIYLSGLKKKGYNFEEMLLSSDVVNLLDYQIFQNFFEEKKSLHNELSEIPKTKRKDKKDKQEQILKKQEDRLLSDDSILCDNSKQACRFFKNPLALVENFMKKRIDDFVHSVNCQ